MAGRPGYRGGAGHHDRRFSRHRDDRRGDGRGERRGDHHGDARLISLQVLTKVRDDDAYANLVLPGLLEEAGLSRRDAGFATALTYGALRLRGRYDAIVAHCVDRPLSRVDGVVLDLLRLGAHQLLGMRVPSHAAVSATVDLAVHSAGRGAATFVNAVLRRVSERDLDAWLAVLRAEAPDAASALAAVESHPRWMVKAMRQALLASGRSEEELEALLRADNTEPEVVLCARPGLVAPERLAEEARAVAHQEPRPGDVSPCAVVLTGGDPGRIRAVRDSRAGVEDEASQLVALMLADAPLEGRDERWLDLCAGPGGKAALLGARAAQCGARLVANEVAPHRARLVEASVRALPPDAVLAILSAGAYGSTMASNYNSRPRPAEVLIDGKHVHLIRERETMAEGTRLARLFRPRLRFLRARQRRCMIARELLHFGEKLQDLGSFFLHFFKRHFQETARLFRLLQLQRSKSHAHPKPA